MHSSGSIRVIVAAVGALCCFLIPSAAQGAQIATFTAQAKCVNGVEHVSGAVTVDTEWSPACVYVVDAELMIEGGVTLTVDPGTVVKSADAAGIEVQPGGSLVATGTASAPVTFTALSDDSVAGDTNGDGNATSPNPGDWAGLVQDVSSGGSGAGTIALAGVRVDYARDGVSAVTDGVTVTGSRFDHESQAAVLVSGYTGSASGWYAGNTASGSPVDGVLFLGTVNLTKNTLINNGAGWAVVVSVPNTETHLFVRSGATLTIAAGAALKFGDSAASINVGPGAKLTDTGTSATPATFTSAFDNTLGAPAGSQFTTSPKPGDWAGLNVQGKALTLKYAHLRYASTAINLNVSSATLYGMTIAHSTVGVQTLAGEASYRGAFSSVGLAIAACDWRTTCAVDAAHSTWNGRRGPFGGVAPLACGTVTVSPWNPAKAKTTTFRVPNCSGAPTPGDALTAAVGDFQNATDTIGEQCVDGDPAAVLKRRRRACIVDAVSNPTSPFPLPSDSLSLSNSVLFGEKLLGNLDSFLQGAEPVQISSTTRTLLAGTQILTSVAAVPPITADFISCNNPAS